MSAMSKSGDAASTSLRSLPVVAVRRCEQPTASMTPLCFSTSDGSLRKKVLDDDRPSILARTRSLYPLEPAWLIIAGSGPEEEALRRLAGPDVLFLGVLDRKSTLPRLYASADVFLFSSLTETLGLVVLEGMASGLPVIATPAGGVADHLRKQRERHHGPTTHDSDAMASAIVELTLNVKRRAELSAGARRTALPLDWEAELDRLDASYRNVLERATRHEEQTRVRSSIFDSGSARGAGV